PLRSLPCSWCCPYVNRIDSPGGEPINLPQRRPDCTPFAKATIIPGPCPRGVIVIRRIPMFHLIAVTLLWAVSFSLIGEYLAGEVDSYFSVLTRIVLAGALFLPLLRPRQLPHGVAPGLLVVGALQFGLTYICL